MKEKHVEKIFCERCGERLTRGREKWLELSQTDGNFYDTIPDGHISQGAFPFGTKCATLQLKQTIEKIKP